MSKLVRDGVLDLLRSYRCSPAGAVVSGWAQQFGRVVIDLGSGQFCGFVLGEREHFLPHTRLFVVKFGVVVLVTVHWNTMVCLSYCLSVTSPSKFLLGVLKSVDGFAAIAVAMLLTLDIRLLSVLWIWWWAEPCLRDERLCPAGCDAGTSSHVASTFSPYSW